MRRGSLLAAFRLTAVLACLALLDGLPRLAGTADATIAAFGALPVVLFGAAALVADR